MKRTRVPQKKAGYILLELIIALTMFAIAVLGLAKALSNSMEVANILNKDYAVRMAIRSFLEEIRRKPFADIPQTLEDATTGATLTSTLEPFSVKSKQGRTFEDLQKLTITASYTAAGQPRDETVSVLLYRTTEDDSRRKEQ
jgi:type II secretory pathway pseudopilin PulG